MTDTSDFKRIDLNEAADEEGSFASWLPPLLSTEPSEPPAATLTGLGPPSGPRASAGPEPGSPAASEPEDDPDFAPASMAKAAAGASGASTSSVVSPSATAPVASDLADADDDDDAPTRVLTQLFPNLTPRRNEASDRAASLIPPVPPQSRPRSSPPRVERPLGALPQSRPPKPRPAESASAPAAAPPVEPTAAPDAEPTPAVEPAVAPTVELAVVPTPERQVASPPEPTTPSASDAAGQAAPSPALEPPLDEDPIIVPEPGPEHHIVEPVAAQAPPATEQLPTIQIAEPSDRDRPTSPSSRRLTPTAVPSLEPPTIPMNSERPWASSIAGRLTPTSRPALRIALFAFAASAVVTVLILRALIPGKGTLLVTAVGNGGMPVENAQVFVDGNLACAPAPCRVSKLREGRHLVTVKAAGYQHVPERAVNVDASEEALVHFALAPENTATLHVRVDAKNLRVFLNGEDRGEAPITLGGLAPTEHTLRLAGNPLYAPYEQKIVLKPNSTVTLTPQLVSLQAFISILPGNGADKAAVEVIGGPQRKAVVELPARIEVPSVGTYRVRATRKGYQDYETEVSFADGNREKEVRIELVPAPEPAAAARTNVLPVVLEETPTPAPAKPITPAPAATAGTGTLTLSSEPPSSVIVDGRPMGPTPRQVPIAAGTHSVVFVHPTLGRRTLSVKVEPGKNAVASTKF